MRPYIIGISGPGTSGKTTLCQHIQQRAENIQIVHLDNYWLDPSTFPELNGWLNWECPEDLDFDLLYKNLLYLRNNKETKGPYCLKGERAGMMPLIPTPVILLEGFLIFYHKRIRELCDYRIFIDLDDEEIVKRRLQRKRSSTKTEDYFRNVAIPEYYKYGQPTRKFAHETLDGHLSTEKLTTKVEKIINKFDDKACQQ